MLRTIGLTLFWIGFVSVTVAMFLVRPGVSRFAPFMRGSFQRRADYTDVGWRLLMCGRIAAGAGIALAVAAIFVSAQH